MKAGKLKWYGVLFALFVLFLYIMGTYDLFMMLSHNEAYYLSKGYGTAVHEYFTDYPPVALIFWAVNLLSGLMSPLLYLLKNKSASKAAFVSGFSDLLLILYGVIFRNRFHVFSTFINSFDIGILVITFLFALFLYIGNRRNDLKERGL